jgi:hypothetical protein
MMIRPWLWLPATLAFAASPASAQDEDLRKAAMKLHEAAGGTYCERPEGAYVPEDDYAEWTFEYMPSWGASEDDKEEITLVRIFCGAGAYNLIHAYNWQREFDGLQPLALAQPTFDVAYENEETLDGAVLGITLTGFAGTTTLVNSEFDPQTLSITSHSLWRGLGDASSDGTWRFVDGMFTLVRFDVDASYDGEMNPETLVDYGEEE